MSNLTPQLNADQLKANITALQKGGVTNDKVQAYVDQYKSDGKGGYVLAAPGPAADPSLVSRVATDTQGHAAGIAQDISSGLHDAAAEPNPLKAAAKAAGSGLDIVGHVASEVGDLIGEPLKSAYSAAVPQSVKDSVSGAVKTIAGTPAAKAVVSALADFEAQHPEASKAFGNILNIAGLFGGGAGEGAAKDAVVDAASGAKDAVVDAASSAADAAKSAAKTVVKAPITAAKDLATPIDENVLTVLKNPTEDTEATIKDLFDKAKTAVTQTGTETPFDAVGKKNFGAALDTLKGKLSAAGKTMQDVLSTSGSKPVDIAPIAEDFDSGLQSRLGTAIDEEGSFADAPGRMSLISGSPSDSRIVGMVRDTIKTLGDNPSLQQVNDAVDKLQGELYKAPQKGAEAINGNTQSFLKGVLGKLNQAAKDVGGDEYTEANSEYSRLKNLRDDLNVRLGKNMRNAGSMTKRIFSPQDGGTKDLVKALETETGQPIFHDATLAKFAMDAVGDPRAKSLLQTTMDAKSKGFVKALIDHVTKRLEDPEGKALRIVNKSK